jgi:hypothetical protein
MTTLGAGIIVYNSTLNQYKNKAKDSRIGRNRHNGGYYGKRK